MSYVRDLYYLVTDYLTRSPLSPQTDRDVDVIDIGNLNTVHTLRDQLARLVRAGYADSGFPILSTDTDGKSRMLGFIGGNELEHALSTFLRISSGLPRTTCGSPTF
jgi:chloride channel 3/4/5